MQLYALDTELFKLDGGAIFGVVPKSIWSKKVMPDANNLISLAMRLLLVEDGNRLILIDTGIGNKQDDKFFGYYYLDKTHSLQKSLAKHGFSADDITDVLLTHLHFDHVGGAVERIGEKLSPTFKNAIYWSNEAHWQWAVNPNPREKASFLKENILPIEESGQLQFIKSAADKQVVSFCDNIDLRFVYGHTEAMMIPQIKYKGKTIVYTADLVISTYHLPVNYVAAYDVSPLNSMQEKQSFLTEAVDHEYILFFEHDAETACCTVQKHQEKFMVKDIIHPEDIL